MSDKINNYQKNWWEYYDVIQLLKEYKGFYCISYAAITDDIKAGMEALEGQQDVIVYVGNSELDEEITKKRTAAYTK